MTYKIKYREGDIVRYRNPLNPDDPNKDSALVVLALNPLPAMVMPQPNFRCLIGSTGVETYVTESEISER